ncbi:MULTISPECIES: MFS transporter [unclassified Sphingobium]|uniref:MFS transporter n=1 Tax=unclassified Sphingobium TaxID=2611147 RepID=UPI000D1769EE|nr:MULTISPECIES: MFS transporter [unclassified Sphingobium]PSO09703.1 MFS transporter [Sphingobium sp. AEW4]TWD19024.1 putative MFS transporter [Sphingobium sp. AEW013]
MTDISHRLDTMRFGAFHRRLLVIGGSGYAFDAMDVAIIGFVLPIVTVQWGLSGTAAGVVAGSGAIGGILGALAAGRLGDVLGRRAIMMWALAIYCVATIASAFAFSFDLFLAARIIAGIGTSAESVIIAPFLAEFAPARLRGRYTGALTGFFSFGYIAAAVLGWLVVPMSDAGWRWALGITALPIVLLLWWRRSLPESPRWLEGRGRRAEAGAIVDAIEAECGRDEVHVPVASNAVNARDGEEVGVASLFRSPLLRSTIVALVLWGVMGCCYYAFMTWIPGLLVTRGLTLTKSFGFTIAIYGAQVPGYFSAAWANDRIGRRNVIAIYLGLGALGALFLSQVQTPTGLLWASVMLSFALNGVYAGLYSYTPELFPTAVRATAQGIATAASRVGAMVSPILVGALYPVLGFGGVFASALVLLATGALTVLLLGPGTNGVALD